MKNTFIEYEVEPLKRIGPLLLGMSRIESRRAMRPETCTFSKSEDGRLIDAYHDSAFQVFFDDHESVEYIELWPSPYFAALYKGVNVHSNKAKEIVFLISKDASFDPDDPELGNSYIFPSLELIVWRPVNLDNHYDGYFFAAIGVGRKGYYSTPSKRCTSPC